MASKRQLLSYTARYIAVSRKVIAFSFILSLGDGILACLIKPFADANTTLFLADPPPPSLAGEPKEGSVSFRSLASLLPYPSSVSLKPPLVIFLS